MGEQSRDWDEVKISKQLYPELKRLNSEVGRGISTKPDSKAESIENSFYAEHRTGPSFVVQKIGDIFVCPEAMNFDNHHFRLTNSVEVARIWAKKEYDNLQKEYKNSQEQIEAENQRIAYLNTVIPVFEKILQKAFSTYT